MIGTLKTLENRIEDLHQVGIKDVVVISADKYDAAKELSDNHGLKSYTFGYVLTETQIRTLGLYMSSPTDYIPQTQNFSEPAYFVLTANNQIKYIDIASAPFGGRVNIDNLVAALNYIAEVSKTKPEFANHFWGNQ